MNHHKINRRSFQAAVAAAWLAPRASFARPGDPARAPLIIRNDRPLNAETAVESFDHWLTPVESFFVRSHFGAPAVTLAPWSISVQGAVDQPLELSLEELGRVEATSHVAVLQCAGNGRAMFEPLIPGVPWERGAVANGEWRGVSLAALLREAGLKKEAAHVHFYGADAPPNPKTPAFLRSIPLERALDDSTLLATHLNNRPLPPLNGGPVRLVVPGWTGNHWIKWVRGIVVSHEEAPGFFQRTGYKMPRTPVAPGVNVPPDEMVSVTTMPVKSLISRPSRTDKVAPGPQTIQGVAWTGLGTIQRVEVAIDDGPWCEARLDGPQSGHGWRLWRSEWLATPGKHRLRARATDSNGATQPDVTPWNKSGYLWNGIDVVETEVRA